jgi:type IV secretion system protein TrbE
MVTLIFLFAGAGLLLLGLLAVSIFQTQREARLSKHRSTAHSVADLLNYAACVRDGVIVTKSGAFMAAWLYRGADAESATPPEREAVSLRINQALAGLGNGWMVHVDAFRVPSPKYPERGRSYFPDRVSAAIDEERRRLFEKLGEMYEGHFILTITYFPPLLIQKKFVELLFDDEAKPSTATQRTTAILDEFERNIESIENRLSMAFSLQRLKSVEVQNEDGSKTVHDEFLSWLQFCITGISHPITLPKNPMYLDCILGGQELWGGVIPKLGRKFIQVVAIEGLPMESHPGMLTSLGELPMEYRWSSRFIFMDQHEAEAVMDKYRKKWKQKIRGFFDQVFNTGHGHEDKDAREMTTDAENALADIRGGLVASGYYTSVVVLMHEDRAFLESCARRVEKAINLLGFAARIETVNTLDAFFGSLPGHGVENIRRPLINSFNLADLLPVSTVWTGSVECPCPFYPPKSPVLMHCVTQGATPLRMNLHVRDVGHTFMFGPTGAGKSTHLALIAAQLRRYSGMKLFAFDKGMSLYPLVKGCGGVHFTVAADDEQLSFCPLQFLETKGDRAWALEWIDTMLALSGLNTTPGMRNEIGNALNSMHNSQSNTLSDFTVLLQNEAMREALKHYTIDGSMGHLLDAEKDGLNLADFMVFEIEELMNLGDKFALPVLLYLFRRIERALDGSPAVILLDEAWIMLGHPTFRAKIREWLKVMRKANCVVFMATQSLSDATESGILDVIMESTPTKIFLPNIYARDEETAALYRRMGLNARQIEILATAVPKREYYLMSEAGRRLYELAIGKLAMAFVGSSDKESLAMIKQLSAKHGTQWVDEWLASKGLSLADYSNN